jgi:hypothetical protein
VLGARRLAQHYAYAGGDGGPTECNIAASNFVQPYDDIDLASNLSMCA